MVWAKHLCDACCQTNWKKYTISAIFRFLAVWIFEQRAKSRRSSLLWNSNGCESVCACVGHGVWIFRFYCWPLIRLTIIQMPLNWRSNQILIYHKKHTYAIMNETKIFYILLTASNDEWMSFAIDLKRVFGNSPNWLSNLFLLFWKNVHVEWTLVDESRDGRS